MAARAGNKIVCDLPFPPSTNSIWRGGKHIRLSDSYKAWKREAGLLWLSQRLIQPKKINGFFRAILLLHYAQNRKIDIDNRIKAVLDFAESMELIENDSLCRALYVRFAEKSEAPTGCRLILREHKL